MGKVFVTDTESPVSAMAFVGCFAFYAGALTEILIQMRKDKFGSKCEKICPQHLPIRENLKLVASQFEG